MKKYNNLVMVANYKGSEDYLYDYFKSIKNQNNKNFDLLIINDNVRLYDDLKLGIRIHQINVTGNIHVSQVRFKGIKYALDNGYKKLIFSDIDDYYSENRISETLKHLDYYDFVYNKINLIDKNANRIEKFSINTYTVPKYINDFRSIIDFNYLGLTNTAVNIESLANIVIPDKIIGLDWWIFTIILIKGSEGIYLENVISWYRQYEDNIVGMNKVLTSERLDFGIELKINHYNLLLNYCNQFEIVNPRNDYLNKKNEIKELQIALEKKTFRKKYIEVVNNNIREIYKGWWSEILTLKQWKYYE